MLVSVSVSVSVSWIAAFTAPHGTGSGDAWRRTIRCRTVPCLRSTVLSRAMKGWLKVVKVNSI